MRTTITLDDHLLDRLKRRAAETGSTVSRLVETAVRAMLAPSQESPSDDPEFELITYGRGGRFTDVDLDKTWRLLEQDDVDRFTRGGG